jgi:hypothetical protein
MKLLRRFLAWLFQVQYVFVQVIDTEFYLKKKPKAAYAGDSLITVQVPITKVSDFIISQNNVSYIIVPQGKDPGLVLKVDFVERYYDIVTGRLTEIAIYCTI